MDIVLLLVTGVELDMADVGVVGAVVLVGVTGALLGTIGVTGATGTVCTSTEGVFTLSVGISCDMGAWFSLRCCSPLCGRSGRRDDSVLSGSQSVHAERNTSDMRRRTGRMIFCVCIIQDIKIKYYQYASPR